MIYRNGSLASGGFRGTDPKQFNCKMRTRDSIDQGAWPGGSPNNSPGLRAAPLFGFGAGGDALLNPTPAEPQTCEAVNDRTIASVWAGLSPAAAGSLAVHALAARWSPAPMPRTTWAHLDRDDLAGVGSYLEPAVNQG